WFVGGLLVLNLVLGQLIPTSESQRLNVPYTFLRAQVAAGNITEVNGRNDVIQGSFKTPTKFKDQGPQKKFETVRPTFATDDGLFNLLSREKVQVNASSIDQGRSFLATLL